MMLSVPIQEDWIKQQAYLQPLSGKSLDIPVRGTLNQPQVDWRAIATLSANLATGTAVQAGQNAIQRELNKQFKSYRWTNSKNHLKLWISSFLRFVNHKVSTQR
jgi:hypothetical protein